MLEGMAGGYGNYNHRKNKAMIICKNCEEEIYLTDDGVWEHYGTELTQCETLVQCFKCGCVTDYCPGYGWKCTHTPLFVNPDTTGGLRHEAVPEYPDVAEPRVIIKGGTVKDLANELETNAKFSDSYLPFSPLASKICQFWDLNQSVNKPAFKTWLRQINLAGEKFPLNKNCPWKYWTIPMECLIPHLPEVMIDLETEGINETEFAFRAVHRYVDEIYFGELNELLDSIFV